LKPGSSRFGPRGCLGLVAHYDDLVRASDAVEHNRRALLRLPPGLGDDDSERLEATIQPYDRAVNDKAERVERFKSNLAVLRNALRLIPVAVDDLAADPAVPDGHSRGLGPKRHDYRREDLTFV